MAAKKKAKGQPPVAGHWKKNTLIEEYWVPEHAKRRESALFRTNKKFLRDDCKLPCWVCRKRGTKKNGLEVHHVFEWALWNLMDPARVTAILEVLEFYEDGYVATAKAIKDLKAALETSTKAGTLATPDDIRNLVVLCQEHHRSRFTGVHMISFPIWIGLAAVNPKHALVRADIVRAANQLRRIDEATSDIVIPAED